MSDQTVVSLYEIDNVRPHHCGYCNTDGSISNGMSSEQMRIEDYQGLIDRGWRRSGTYLYKPIMNLTCCPLYTIKCDTLKFQLRKSQKYCSKIVKKYLEKNERKKEKEPKSKNGDSNGTEVSNISNSYIENRTKQSQNTHAKKIMAFFLGKNFNFDEIKGKNPIEILGIPKLKAKHIRLFKKLLKLKEQNKINSFPDILNCLKRKLPKPDSDSIENYLDLDYQNLINKLEIKLVRSWPPSDEFNNSLKKEHELYTKYQMTIHNDTISECSVSQFKRFLCTSPLLKDSYNGPLKNFNHSEFLKRTDIRHNIIGDVTELGYGSFHQQYYLNGKLVAVGVIDILDKCVSSVYFFYDPDIQFLNLGTYSALREIAFTRQLQKLDPNIKWYYLGFYVHECKKMRYKGFFYPSYLACPEVYTWHSIEKCVPLLNVNKYSRFAPREKNDGNVIIDDQDQIEDINNLKIRVKLQRSEKVVRFVDFCEFLNPGYVPEFTRLVKGYCKLFGKKVSNQIQIKF